MEWNEWSDPPPEISPGEGTGSERHLERAPEKGPSFFVLAVSGKDTVSDGSGDRGMVEDQGVTSVNWA